MKFPFPLKTPLFLQRHADRIKASPVRLRFALGSFWSLSGTIIARGFGLISSIFVARILGREGFGELGMIQSTIGTLAMFAGFGLGLTAIKYVAEFREKDPPKAARIIALSSAVSIGTGLFMASLLAVSADFLAERALSAAHLAGILRVSALLLLLGALNGSQTGALSGFEAFRAIAGVNIAAGVFSFPLVVAGAYWKGLEGVVWGLVGSTGINCLLNHIVLRKEAARAGVKLVRKDFLKEWSILHEFSLPAVLGSVMVGPANWICNAMLANQPRGYTEMGIFNAANQWRTAILFLPGVVGSVVLPILSNLQSPDDRTRYNKILWYNILLAGVVSFGGALIISLFASLIMKVYGRGFESGQPVVIWLCFSSVFSSISAVIGYSIASDGRMWWGVFLNFLWALVLVGTAWVFISKGALGLALSNFVAYGIHLLTLCFYASYFLINSKE